MSFNIRAMTVSRAVTKGLALTRLLFSKKDSKITCLVILLADSVVIVNRNLHALLARHVFLLAQFRKTRKSLIRAVTLTPAISHRQACLSTYYLGQRIETDINSLSIKCEDMTYIMNYSGSKK